jgi:outer membrane receptor protein involved in Fe transport
VPGFSLFRRTDSLFANPTTQGVSMMGIGASGASRAVVLLDGIPLNDPFGGWVYWNQVPRVDIDSVQVINGGASDTYGSGALGGVVNIATRKEQKAFGTLEASYGNENTPDISFAGGYFPGQWGITGSGQALKTDGYILVPPSVRGLVDVPAGTSDLVGTLELSRRLGEQGRFFIGGTTFAESRQNGTPVTTNNTRIPTYRLGGDWSSSVYGSFSGRVYGSSEIFNQNFSSVAANRNSETLSDRQRSPSQQIGFAGQWRKTIAGRHSLSAGVEYRDVRGHSAEVTFAASGAQTADVDAGGRQGIVGVFVQDAYYFARNWLLTAGGRGDFADNSLGFMNRKPLPAGTPTSSTIPELKEGNFSPRLGLLRTLPHNVSLSATYYRAFRDPTLNELYRNFRVGNTVTDANPFLVAERLNGGEAGASWRSWREKLTVRGDFFWNDITSPVANVTLSFAPASCSSNPTTCTLITRERENLGAIQARGFELSAELHLPFHLVASGSYILTDSRVISAPPPNQALLGLMVPQVPLNSFTAQITYAARKWTASVQGRFTGNQFDDDQNLLPLGNAFVVDAQVSRRLVSKASIFFAATNLFNDTYDIARTPVVDVGPPIMVRGGFRMDIP